MADGYVKFSDSRFFVRFQNLHSRNDGFAELYHVVVLEIFVEAHTRRDEESIRIPYLHVRRQQIFKFSRKFVVGLEL